ncbi:hypothetical protein OJ252_2701 [Cryptosporidium canis]|uniref:Uncharacterized protein n=1 Tax=Cryptosporidium canis TaxID=195482 RepID=A0ABQ8P4I2_9CRYT|nr:hypothetical protein OJ252_2701 [Cryptosporidium canis]
MATCFGKRRSIPDRCLSQSGADVYPPPIRIQRSFVIPGFIREGRQLSRTLSLNLADDDSISTLGSESSLESRFERVPSNISALRTGLSSRKIQESDKVPSRAESLSLRQESNVAPKYQNKGTVQSISQPEKAAGGASVASRRVSPVLQADSKVIVNPVNIKPREIKKVNSNNLESSTSIRSINSSKGGSGAAVTSKGQLEDLHFSNYIASNDYIEKYLSRKKSNDEDLARSLENSPIDSILKKPPSASTANGSVDGGLQKKPSSPQQPKTAGQKAPTGRKRILSAPNEPIPHIEQLLNEEPRDKQVIKDAKARHRSSSLRVLAQSVINLMNKRGSKGREERKEIRAINQMLKGMNLPSSNSSEASSRSQGSTSGSDSPQYAKSGSVHELIKKLGSSKKQVSFEMDLKAVEKKRSSRLSKKFSRLTGKEGSSRSNSDVEFSKRPSYDEAGSSNDIENNNNIITLENGVFETDHKESESIKELNIPFTLSKSFSSETLSSNFSLDQRVARTYDMQILTYDQTPIPIPNLPRGRKLESLQNLENCYLVMEPNISNIFSLCRCS